MIIHEQDVAKAVLERTVFNRDVGKVSFVESCGDTWADAAEGIITKLRDAGAKRGQVLSIDAHTTPECAAIFSAHFSSQMKDQGPLDAQFIKISGAPVQSVTQTPGAQMNDSVNETRKGEASIKVPLDRCFDVQWNPPGVPELRCRSLKQVYRDDVPLSKGGYYTFSENEGAMSFSRVLPDGTKVRVFSRVTFMAISESVLMMNGDGNYGTLFKGPKLKAGDESIREPTQAASTKTALEWLESNFTEPEPEPAGEDGWSALCQNAVRAIQTVGSSQDIISITGSLANDAPAYYVFYYPRTGLKPWR